MCLRKTAHPDNQPLKLELHMQWVSLTNSHMAFVKKPLHAGFDHRTLCIRIERSTTRPYALELFNLLIPFVNKIHYWKSGYCASKIRPKLYKSKKLTLRDEFLLILMRLRLEILNEDLAGRCGISNALCSKTFTTWIRILSSVLGSALVVWLPRESIHDNLPHA